MQETIKARLKSSNKEFLFSALLFGSVGATTWAIRGTSGWGGVDGTIIPGLAFGLIWYYLSIRKNIDSRYLVFWLGLGIALGGELGYGQYTGWIRNIFSYGNEKIFVDSATGYIWFIICGIGWAGPGGIILGWAINSKISIKYWIVRIILTIMLLVLLFSPDTIDYLSQLFLDANFNIIYPNFNLGIYENIENNLSRTLYTNTQNFAVLVWWIAAIFTALLNKDKITLISGLILGLGFGLGFMQGAIWTLGYGSAPAFVDWWKLWELNAGFNLGILYAVVFVLFEKRFDIETMLKPQQSKNNEKLATVFQAISGFILLYFVGFEYFPLINTIIAILFSILLFILIFSEDKSEIIKEKRTDIIFQFSVFYLLFILFHGVTDRLGIVVGIFNEESVDQYSWPVERIYLFAPLFLSILALLFVKIKQIFAVNHFFKISHDLIEVSNRKLLILTALITLVGIISIWPAKISIFYALFQLIAIISLIQLENIDRFKNLELTINDNKSDNI